MVSLGPNLLCRIIKEFLWDFNVKQEYAILRKTTVDYTLSHVASLLLIGL